MTDSSRSVATVLLSLFVVDRSDWWLVEIRLIYLHEVIIVIISMLHHYYLSALLTNVILTV